MARKLGGYSMLAAIHWLFEQPRSSKRIISMIIDSFFITVAYWGAIYLKFSNLKAIYSPQYWLVLLVLLGSSLFCFARLGLYRAVLRYVDNKALSAIAIGVVVPTIVMVAMGYYLHAELPAIVPIVYVSWVVIICGSSRMVVRSLYQQNLKKHKEKVVIYGAGEAGRQLAVSLQNGLEYSVVAFIDDNLKLHHTSIYGIYVYGSKELIKLGAKYKIKKLLLAMPSVSRCQRRAIIEALPDMAIETLTVPGVADIVSGKAKIDELKRISIEDLLGRDRVEPFQELISANIRNKVVMITGAGGSIGGELCRQVLLQKPSQLILYESSEYALYKIEQSLIALANKHGITLSISPILASIADQLRLETTLQRFKVQTIYHAAAYKHVPMVEWNVVAGLRNNAFGTFKIAQAAVETKVETFVLISTDKAVRPTNVMGASKRLAELVCQAFALKQSQTKFCMVRFGNVLGSSGSVVPLITKQIQQGGPVTVTHRDITRYFMTIKEAAQLVIQAGAMSQGGDVFVLDMGQPIKIYDLAKKMIALMGLEEISDEAPQGDIEIKITGLRPGEKLFEELIISDNDRQTQHPRIRTADEACLSWSELNELLTRLDLACIAYDQALIRKILLEAPLSYSPQDPINDLVWKSTQSDGKAGCLANTEVVATT